MTVVHKLNIDMNHKSNLTPIEVMQDDRYTQAIEFTFTSDGSPWVIPDDCNVMIHYIKPDGTGGSYDQLPDGSHAYQVARSNLYITLAPQVCTAPGITRLTATLSYNDEQISVFTVDILVHRNPRFETVSEDFVKIFGTLPDGGWEAGKYLGTDENGKVVAKDFWPEELMQASEAIERIIDIQQTLMGGAV